MSKILLIGDIHLGMGYPNSVDKWFEVSREYFNNFLFPILEKELDEDDIIVLLGDLFDNRNVIPINILNYAQYILEKMSKICPVHLIVGNHDLYTKSTNDVNTIKLYKYIPNVYVYESPSKIEYMGKSILMLPWVEKRKDQVEILKKFSGCDYLFCHSDLNGAKMHLNSVAHKNNDKIDVDEFKGYRSVWSGHIHIQQRNKNFTFVGSIHEMDRNDLGNQKGVFILDVIGNNEVFIPNDLSPKHQKVYIMSENDIDSLDKVSIKNYVDLYISNTLLINNRKLRRKLEVMLESGNFASVDYIDDIKEAREDKLNDLDINDGTNDDIDVNHINVQLDYKEFIRDYIIQQKYDDNIKYGILQEYNEIIKVYEENY